MPQWIDGTRANEKLTVMGQRRCMARLSAVQPSNRRSFPPLQVMRCGLVSGGSGLGFVSLVEHEKGGIALALQDVKALIAWLLDGFLMIED